MMETVGAFAKQLQTLQQEFQQNTDGVKSRQQQMEHDFSDVEHQREVFKRESVMKLNILDRKRDEMKNIKSEVQQQHEQQERAMERMVAQQVNKTARRAQSINSAKGPISESAKNVYWLK